MTHTHVGARVSALPWQQLQVTPSPAFPQVLGFSLCSAFSLDLYLEWNGLRRTWFKNKNRGRGHTFRTKRGVKRSVRMWPEYYNEQRLNAHLLTLMCCTGQFLFVGGLKKKDTCTSPCTCMCVLIGVGCLLSARVECVQGCYWLCVCVCVAIALHHNDTLYIEDCVPLCDCLCVAE